MKYLEVLLQIKDVIETESLFKKLDEGLSSLKNETVIEDTENTISIFITKGESVTGLKDFMEEGKMIKTIGLEYGVFDKSNYGKYFSIKEVKEIKDNKKELKNSEIDSMITKVPKDDKKLLDIMNQIKGLKK